MTVAVIILAISAIIVAAELACAPCGWQDERGFHFGKPPGDGE